ncbi:MAG: hypothetical protein ABFR89_04045 [Actinomycetota bacterium]
MQLLAVLMLSVTLAAPFGEAEARALEVDSGMTVEVAVEVDGGHTAVLARVVAFAGELPPVALIDQGDGQWLGVMRFTGREDVQVAFEAIDAAGKSDISALSTLTEMGVDPAVISASRPTRPPDEEPGPNWLLIVGVGAGVAALLLVFVWALSGGLDKRSENFDNSGDVDRSMEEPEQGADD